MIPTENLDVCLATLRDTDRDRYLACLLSPSDKRSSLAALYAFNAEIARIRDSAREALPGEVRMQWWRDLLNGNTHGDSQLHPVATALLTTIEQHHLPRSVLVNMIEARIFDLYDDLFEDRNALEGYGGETASALIQLASLVLSPEEAPASAEAAGHAGIAQAMSGILLLMALHRRRGQVYIPSDMLSAAGLDRETFLEGEDRQRIGIAIELFAVHALDHLEKARLAKIFRAVFVAYLPVSLSKPVIIAARKVGSGVFEGELQLSQLRRQWLLAKALLLKHF